MTSLLQRIRTLTEQERLSLASQGSKSFVERGFR